GRPEQDREQAREDGQGRNRRLRHRPGGDRRRRYGDQAGERLARRLEAGSRDAEVPQGADALGQRELLEEAALGLRQAVPRDRDQQQHPDPEGDDRRQEGPEQPGLVGLGGGRTADREARGIAPGLLRL